MAHTLLVGVLAAWAVVEEHQIISLALAVFGFASNKQQYLLDVFEGSGWRDEETKRYLSPSEDSLWIIQSNLPRNSALLGVAAKMNADAVLTNPKSVVVIEHEMKRARFTSIVSEPIAFIAPRALLERPAHPYSV